MKPRENTRPVYSYPFQNEKPLYFVQFYDTDDCIHVKFAKFMAIFRRIMC